MAMTEKQREWWESRRKDSKLAYAALMKFYPLTLDDLDDEEWRDIFGYEGDYQESNYGRTKSFKFNTPRIVVPDISSGGYLQVHLYKENRRKVHYVHVLVAQAFVDNSKNLPKVDHRFGMRLDNYAGNLEWVTSSENTRRAVDNGLIKSGSEHYVAKLKDEEVIYCRDVHIPGDTKFGVKALAKEFKVSPMAMSMLLRGKTYKKAVGDKKI